MRVYFDKETDKRLLEAQTEEEVKAIIAGTPDAGKLADKIDLVMAELAKIKGELDNELDIDELDSAAGGAKRQDIYLSETTSCVATFYLEDDKQCDYCWSNDQCGCANEYKYHYTKYSNCKKGGRHIWKDGIITIRNNKTDNIKNVEGHECTKCRIKVEGNENRFND